MKKIKSIAAVIGLGLGLVTSAKAQYTVNTDADLDGLDASAEAVIGTNPLIWDSNGNVFNDGVEYYNGSSHAYDVNNIEEVVAQDDSYHRIMAAFDNGEGNTIAYIRAETDFANPRIAVAHLGDTNEIMLTAVGDLQTPFNFNQVVFSPDDSRVLFASNGDLYGVGVASQKVEVIQDNNSGSLMFNPEVTWIGQQPYLLISQQIGTARGINSYPIDDSGNITGSARLIVNFDGSGGVGGTEDYPRASVNEDNFVFGLKIGSNLITYYARGLGDIIQGITTPITNIYVDQPRRVRQSSVSTKNIPSGIGSYGNVGLQTVDLSHTYVIGSGDFSTTDFDIFLPFIVHHQSSDPEDMDAILLRIPFVGEQPYATLDRSGTRMVFASDFNPYNIPKSNQGFFSLLAASTGTIGADVNVRDPSGITLEPQGTIQYPVSAEQVISIRTPLNPISDASNYEGDKVILLRNFYPEGTQFLGAPAILTMPYRDADIEGLVEESLKISLYDPSSRVATPIDTIVDTVNNRLTAEITHFSTYAALASLEPTTPVLNWGLYR